MSCWRDIFFLYCQKPRIEKGNRGTLGDGLNPQRLSLLIDL